MALPARLRSGITNRYAADRRRINGSILNSSSAILAATAHGYDAASRLATVADGHGNTATYNYLANSPLVSQMTFQQNGATRVTTTKTYDDLNRLTQKSSQPTASGLPPVTFNYTPQGGRSGMQIGQLRNKVWRAESQFCQVWRGASCNVP